MGRLGEMGAMPTSFPLLTVKLRIAPAPSALVARPRLLDRLDDGVRVGRRMTLVSAPAGYGKTSLLSHWARHCHRDAAWLSLDEEDSDPARFLAYLVAALRGIGAVAWDMAPASLTSLRPFSAHAVLPVWSPSCWTTSHSPCTSSSPPGRTRPCPSRA